MSPPSETVELNRTSSVNLTCLVSGQPGAQMEWYKNGLRIPDPPLSLIHRTQYGNGTVKSVLTLKSVKYRDRGSIVSCTAWYPSLSINSTRNIHLLVHGNVLHSSTYPSISYSGLNPDFSDFRGKGELIREIRNFDKSGIKTDYRRGY